MSMFITTSSEDLWRSVPPEEKLQLMARAHSRGTLSCVILVILAATLSVCFQMSWLLWAGFIAIPFAFQFSAGKAWRALRPTVMLEYLAARAAARRYAYVVKSERLDLNFLFRGRVEHIFEDDESMDELEASIENTREAAVWIALFADCVVLMSEKQGGAELEFGCLLNERFSYDSDNSDSDEGYDGNRELTISYEDKYTGMSRVKLTSPYPAAMVVFEKRMQRLYEEWQMREKQVATDVEDPLNLEEFAE